MRHLLVLSVCSAGLAYGAEQVQPAADASKAMNNLKQIGVGCVLHEFEHKKLPADIKSAEGKPLLSWRVAILPYIEHEATHKQFKLDEPWDSPHNQKLLEKMPAVFKNPRQKTEKASLTCFRGFSGAGGVLGTKNPLTLTMITNINGTSNTFLVVEAPDSVPWTKPDDLVHDLNKPLPKLNGPGGFFLALYCDLHISRIPNNTPEETIRRMIQWNNTKWVEPPK